ncbi:MAG: DoxX family protein [Pirellulaceae bacterium]
MSNAKGPLAPSFKQMVWDADGLYRLNHKLTWAYWDNYRNRLIGHYQFSDQQRAQADEVLKIHYQRLSHLLSTNSAEINEYYQQLERRNANAAVESRSLKSFQTQDARIAQERTQLIAPVLSTVDKVWQGLENDLNALASVEQWKRHGRLAIGKLGARPMDSAFVDRWIPYFDIAIGACLILGLFTRPAAIAGGLFLGSVCLSQWPWAEGAAPIYYQAVEMFAMFFLAAIGAGRFAGLDFLLGGARRFCCPPKQGTHA